MRVAQSTFQRAPSKRRPSSRSQAFSASRELQADRRLGKERAGNGWREYAAESAVRLQTQQQVAASGGTGGRADHGRAWRGRADLQRLGAGWCAGHLEESSGGWLGLRCTGLCGPTAGAGSQWGHAAAGHMPQQPGTRQGAAAETQASPDGRLLPRARHARPALSAPQELCPPLELHQGAACARVALHGKHPAIALALVLDLQGDGGGGRVVRG